MSTGHNHDPSLGSRSTTVLDRLLKNPDIAMRVHAFHDLNKEYDLPYLGGYSKNEHHIYIDRHLPETLCCEDDGKKKEFNPAQFIAKHEAFEKAVMDVLGWGYAHAHQAATAFERREVLKHGIFWQPYQNVLKPYIKATKHERLVKIPPDLDMRPYYAPPVNRSLIARMDKAKGGKSAMKQPKAAVAYGDGTNKSHCGLVRGWIGHSCVHFEPPHACDLVRGYIEPRSWCKLWKPAVDENEH